MGIPGKRVQGFKGEDVAASSAETGAEGADKGEGVGEGIGEGKGESGDAHKRYHLLS